MKTNKKKNTIIIVLCLFVFMLSIPSLFTSYNQKASINNENLEKGDSS